MCCIFKTLTIKHQGVQTPNFVSYKKNQPDALISQIYLGMKLCMFRRVPLSIVRSFSLYTQQWYMSYNLADSLRAVSKPVWHVSLLCVQWKPPDDGQRNCPKHVEFAFQNKFEELVHLVSLRERDRWGDRGVDGWIMLGWIFKHTICALSPLEP
jgi:hypothetical protein